MKIKDFLKKNHNGILRIIISGLITISILVGVISCANSAKADTLAFNDKIGDENYYITGIANLNEYKGNSYIVPVNQARKIGFFLTTNMGSYLFANTSFQVCFVDFDDGAIQNTNSMYWWLRFGETTQTIREPNTPNAKNVALYNSGLTWNDNVVQQGSTYNTLKYLNVVQYTQTSVSKVNITTSWNYIVITFPSTFGTPNPMYTNNMIYSPNKELFLTDGVIELPNTTQQQALNFMNISVDTLNAIYQQGITHGYNLGLDYYRENIEPERIETAYNNGYTNARLDYAQEYEISTKWYLALFEGISAIFGIRLFGSLTLGAIVIIPFGISFVWFIIKSLRGGD